MTFYDHPDILEANKFQADIKPIDKIECAWVVLFAKDLFERRSKISTILDDKADAIIRYMGGGTGLLSLGIAFAISPGQGWIILCALPAVLFAISAVLFAIMVRAPSHAPRMPSIKTAFEYAKEYPKEDDAKLVFLGRWNTVCEEFRVAAERKAWWLHLANWLSFCAILSLIIPMIATAFLKWCA